MFKLFSTSGVLINFCFVWLCISCSTAPGKITDHNPDGAGDADTDTDADSDADADSDTDSNTNNDSHDDEENQGDENDTNGEEDDTDTSDEENDTATNDEEDDTATNDEEDDTESSDPDGCPWECRPLAGAGTCSSLGDHWVRNTNFNCAGVKEICCQPLGAPGGLAESCADQPAMNCAKSCTGKLIENPDYYCTDGRKLCCEDPAGPTYGCYDSGGICVSPLKACPDGKVQSPKDCPGLLDIDKCCLEPLCPWSCQPDIGQKSCSTNTNNPSAVRNLNYSCETPSDFCCQPLEPTDSGPQPELTDLCKGEMACRSSCQGYEKQTTDYYCKKSNLICCYDPRPPCADIDGVCELSVLGGCSDGKEPNQAGICESSLRTCCTEIDPSNTCALNGGRCVDLGSSCPTLFLPNFNHFCGPALKTCCMPMVSF